MFLELSLSASPLKYIHLSCDSTNLARNTAFILPLFLVCRIRVLSSSLVTASSDSSQLSTETLLLPLLRHLDITPHDVIMVLLIVTLLRQQSNQLTAGWTKQHVCVRANLPQDRIPFWNNFYGRHRIKIKPTLVLLFLVIRTPLGQLRPETLRPPVSGFLVGAVLGGSDDPE